ncbi:MAG: His/Gly/Thr/Pro-type tRNA ligase C-terminal domain-containing protein [Dongiaceae bacterium]
MGGAQAGYAQGVAQELERHDFRVALDLRPERLSRKIVDARENGIPVLMAVGSKEEQAGSVALRYRDGRQQSLDLLEAVQTLRPEAFPVR